MEFPAYTETLSLENCGVDYCCCICVPTIGHKDRVQSAFESYSRSSNNSAEATNLAARATIEHLLPLHNLEPNDFSSSQIAELETKEQMIENAEAVGFDRITALKHNYLQLKGLYDSVVQILEALNTVFENSDCI
ncbi:hypothetical protein M5689_003269 [Euphorbia peplus]|nr:hypothetical protein M5689_003269 [Euphorbia peplus]